MNNKEPENQAVSKFKYCMKKFVNHEQQLQQEEENLRRIGVCDIYLTCSRMLWNIDIVRMLFLYYVRLRVHGDGAASQRSAICTSGW